MLTKRSTQALIVAGLAANAFAFSNSAQAALVLTITQGAASASVSSPTDDPVVYTGPAVGDFNCSVTIGTADLVGGSIQLNADITRIGNSAPTTPLTITLTDDNLSGPTGPLDFLTSSGSVTFSNTNAGNFVSLLSNGKSGVINVSTPLQTSVATGAPSETIALPPVAAVPFPNGAPYTLKNTSTFNLSLNGEAQFDATTSVTPEPASLSLLGLSAMVLASRRFGRRSTEE